MSEQQELLPPKTAMEKAADMIRQKAEEARIRQQEELRENLAMLGNSPSLDWEKLSPQAQIAYIMTKPFSVRDDDGNYMTCKLQFWDAVAFVGRALELKLSILGNDMFPTIKMTTVGGQKEARMSGIGISSEAKARVAARMGCKFGPPLFTEVEREWPKAKISKKPQWTDKDRGVTCRMKMFVDGVAEGQDAEYTAWLSEWYAGNKSGTAYWDKNPDWMLRIRAKDKCITLASGVGQSEAQQDDAPEVPAAPTPQLQTTEFKPANSVNKPTE